MKKIGIYFVIGCLVAIVGVFFSEICGDFFNGMEYGSACAVGIGLYLCIVVITCTGIIVSKLDSGRKEDRSAEE